MFSLEEFYRKAHEGKNIDLNGFCDWMNQFQHKIIWGAGNLGTAVGKKMLDLGMHIDTYWDSNAAKIGEKYGIKVVPPFTGDYKKEETLVLFCIANVPVSPRLLAELYKNGWNNVIKGLAILEGILCPFSTDTHLDTGYCNSMDICTVCSCERLSNIMKAQVIQEKGIEEQDVLSFDRVHIIVNNFCNLKCTHCFMYMNSYPNERKYNVPLEELEKEVDMVFEAVDSFGVVNIFGGEPFLHPDIAKLVQKVLEKKNYGSIIVNTNGMANIKEEQLEGFEDKRVRLAYSNYLETITDVQKERFYGNIEKTRAKSITVKVQNELPTWNVSSTLGDNHFDRETLVRSKEACGVKFLYILNDKIFPCAMCLSVNDLGIADYPGDYIRISDCKDAAELKEKIRELVNRPYYQSCSHCDKNLPATNKAGEQGFDSRYRLPEEE